MKPIYALLFFGIIGVTLNGCASSEYLGAYSSIQADSLKQISDDEIRQALETQPQITLPTSIAIYNASRDKFSFQDSVLTMNEVLRAVEITPALINPNPYYQSQYYGYRNPIPEPVDLKKLRMYAAMAKTDLILFVSTSTNYEEDVNILSPLYAGLVTIPFVPGQHIRLTTYLEAYVIDVRNGFLYSSYRDKRVLTKKFARVFFKDKMHLYREEHVQDMLPDFLEYVTQTINDPVLQLQNDDD